jgi:hypothetical protein
MKAQHTPEVEANARLIAAAPDLLAALITMTDHGQEQHPHFESIRGIDDIHKAIAAVEKALGIKWTDITIKEDGTKQSPA